MNSPLLRDLPSVDSVISHEAARILLSTVGRDLGIEAIREALSDVRASILADATDHIPDVETLLKIARRKLDAWLAPTLKPVINATGVIVHTNLGRAPLSDDALAALQAVGGTYSTLEYDLDAGIRGSRFTHAEALLTRITGAEAALVVNNNAAAVLLALAGLAGPAPTSPAGKGAVISRGQLVEIGGGFRMPDVMTRSGARLVEVGTT
nr:L-seryl-tRNA(Sec) selenium transferase [Anaerolineae bacterium]